jgi:hypothetical protein
VSDIKLNKVASVPNRGRILERLCTECAAKVAPTKPLRARRLRLRRRQALIFGGMAAVVVREAHSPGHNAWVLSYMAPSVPVQRSSESVIDRFLEPDSDSWDYCVCSECLQRLEERGWEEVELEISPAQDLVFHGLGWLSVRKAAVVFRVVIPAGIHVSHRPQLVPSK